MKKEKPLGKLGEILTESELAKIGVKAIELRTVDEPEPIISEAQSLKDIRSALSTAIYDQFGYSAYIEDWEKQFVYYAKNYNDKVYYKQKYTYDSKTKKAELVGEQVKVDRSWKKVREAVNAHLIESKNSDGSIWRVGLIKVGTSLNGYNYSSKLLRESAPLFEGVKAYLRTDDEHLRDANKSMATIAGVHKNISFNEVTQSLESDFHIIESSLQEKLLKAENLGLLNEIGGMSIVASGNAVKKLREGSITYEVSKLINISSVDPVAEPSAGGNFIKIAAAINKEGDIVLKKMIEALKKHQDLYSQLDPDNIDETKVLELHKELVIREAKVNAPEKKVEKPKVDEPVKVSLAEAEQKKADERYTAWVEGKEKEAKQKELLITKLTESKLPVGAHSLVSNQLTGKDDFTAEDVVAAIEGVRTILAESSSSGKIKGFGDTLEMGDDQKDKFTKAMDGFFLGQDVDKIPRFRSFRESFKQMTGEFRISDEELTEKMFTSAKFVHSGRSVTSPASVMLTESLTSASWAQVLGDSITRRLLAEYNMPKWQEWRRIVSDVVPVRDFRTNRRTRVGGYGDLPTVAESGPYESLASPIDEEATYAIEKKGGLEDLTFEMIANDDVGSIRRIPRNLGRAAARTLYKNVFNVIVNNSVVTYDGVDLFHGGHSNLGATGLNATTLEAATIAMMGQQAYGGTSGDELSVDPKFLLVPLELRDAAFRLTTSSIVIGAANNAGTEPNIHSTMGLQTLVVPYWTDANDWALVCEPMDCPTIEVGFYAGREEPELFVQDNPNIGTPFSNDIITYKIRHIYGIVVLDHRGMYKAVVT